MMKQLIIFGMGVAMISACSSSDDILQSENVQPAEKSTETFYDDNVTREELMGNIPIDFSVIEGNAIVELTRGSSNVNGTFQSGTMGIYCIGAKKINSEANDPKMGGYTSSLWQILNLWLENVSAHIEPIANSNEGYIAWDNPDEKHYYPKKDWYAYKFAAYHPRSEYIVRSETAVMAFIPVDGNDDVFTAIAEDPRVSIDAESDAKAYSHQYFEAVGIDNITAEHRPYYSFKHLTSRLKFKIKLSGDCERELHVDSICFSDFPNIMKVSLAKFDNGNLINHWNNYDFVTNYSDYMPPSLKADLPHKTITVSGQSVDATVVNGHFWLRESDDSSIGEKVNNSYKYVLNTSDYTDVGDCIMIPPVYKSHSKSTIKLEVYLRDNYGNIFTTVQPISIAAPDVDPADPNDKGGWKGGKSYTVKVSIGGNIFFMDQTRGQMTGKLDGYEEETEIEVSDDPAASNQNTTLNGNAQSDPGMNP